MDEDSQVILEMTLLEAGEWQSMMDELSRCLDRMIATMDECHDYCVASNRRIEAMLAERPHGISFEDL